MKCLVQMLVFLLMSIYLKLLNHQEFYKFEKFSTLEDNFVGGNVVLNIVKIDEEKRNILPLDISKEEIR